MSVVPAAPTEPAPSPAGWAFLPPLQRTIGPAPSTTQPLSFPSTLGAWRNPSFMGRMAHAVSESAPSGVIDGDGRGMGATGDPLTRAPHVDLALLTPAPSPAMPLQRSAVGSAPAPVRSPLTAAPVTTQPTLQVASHPFDAAAPTLAQPDLPVVSMALPSVASPSVASPSADVVAPAADAAPSAVVQSATFQSDIAQSPAAASAPLLDLPLVQRAVDGWGETAPGPALTPATAPVFDNGGETVVDLPRPDLPGFADLPVATSAAPASSTQPPASSTPVSSVPAPVAPLQPRLALQRSVATNTPATPAETHGTQVEPVPGSDDAVSDPPAELEAADGAASVQRSQADATLASAPTLGVGSPAPDRPGAAAVPVAAPAAPDRFRLGLGAPLPPGAHTVQRVATTQPPPAGGTAAASPAVRPGDSAPSTRLPLADLAAAITATTGDGPTGAVTPEPPRTPVPPGLPVQRAVAAADSVYTATDSPANGSPMPDGSTSDDGSSDADPGQLLDVPVLGMAAAAPPAAEPVVGVQRATAQPAPAHNAAAPAPALPVQRAIPDPSGPVAPSLHRASSTAASSTNAGVMAAMPTPPPAPAMPLLVQRTAALLGERPIEAMFTPSLAPASAPHGATTQAAAAVRPTYLDPTADLPSPGGARAADVVRATTNVPAATATAPSVQRAAATTYAASPHAGAARTAPPATTAHVQTAHVQTAPATSVPAPVSAPRHAAPPPLALQRFGLGSIAGAVQNRPSLSQLGSNAVDAAHEQVDDRASALTSQLPGGLGDAAQHVVEDPGTAGVEGLGHDAIGAAEGAAAGAAGGAMQHAQQVAGGAAGALAHSPKEIDALAKQLMEPLARRIKAEMLLDRERRGMRSDAR